MLFHQETESEQLDRLRTQFVLTEASYAHMKRVNNYFREHGTVMGCHGVDCNAAKIIDDGIESGEFPDGLPFSNHTVLNNYYEIHRLKQKISELVGCMDKFIGWTFPGGEAVISTEENRLQLKFTEVVGIMKRVILSRYGFSRSSCDNVWERRLDRDAIRAAVRIKFVWPKDCISPEDLQPYQKNR